MGKFKYCVFITKEKISIILRNICYIHLYSVILRSNGMYSRIELNRNDSINYFRGVDQPLNPWMQCHERMHQLVCINCWFYILFLLSLYMNWGNNVQFDPQHSTISNIFMCFVHFWVYSFWSNINSLNFVTTDNYLHLSVEQFPTSSWYW